MKSIKTQNESVRAKKCFIIAQIVFLLIVGLRGAQLFQNLEIQAYDQFLVWRAKQYSIDPRITLISIEENDFAQWGWPLSDRMLKKLLNQLVLLKPAVIGLDLYREKPIPRSLEIAEYPDFESLNRLFRNQSNLIGIEKYSGVKAPPGLFNTSRVGFNDVLRDRDGIVRRGLLYLQDKNRIHWSFPYLLFNAYTGINPKRDSLASQAISLGKGRIVPFNMSDGGYVEADDKGFQFFLDYHGGKESFPMYSMTDVLSEKIPADSINGKIVIVGIVAKSAKDFFLSPFRIAENHTLDLSGIALLGHITSQLIRIAEGQSQTLKTLSEPLEWGFIWIASLIGASTAFWVRRLSHLISVSLLELLALSFFCWIGFAYNWWFPMIPTAMAWFLGAGAVTVYLSSQERREKQFLQQIYSPYLPQDVADVLWQTRDKLLEGNRLRPHALTATVLFSDVRDFSTVAEQLQPAALMDWLNSYMETMLQIVTRHGGMVDKMIGDGIMAVFGAPVKRISEQEICDDAVNAVTCALEMGEVLEKINRWFTLQKLPPIRIRIGVMTGPLVAGSIGNRNRLEYTVLGDTVNINARLESYDKTYNNKNPFRILIGESTLMRLGNLFSTDYVGKVKLKGKSEQIGVYHLNGKTK